MHKDSFANFQLITKFENTELNVLVETDTIPYDMACSILGENTRHIVELNLECLFIEAQMNKCYPKLADAGFIVSNRAVRLEGYLTSSTDVKTARLARHVMATFLRAIASSLAHNSKKNNSHTCTRC